METGGNLGRFPPPPPDKYLIVDPGGNNGSPIHQFVISRSPVRSRRVAPCFQLLTFRLFLNRLTCLAFCQQTECFCDICRISRSRRASRINDLHKPSRPRVKTGVQDVGIVFIHRLSPEVVVRLPLFRLRDLQFSGVGRLIGTALQN